MNLFKSTQEESGYPEVITKIHKEFRSAGEKLYEDALAIINSAKLLNEEKVVRLKKLGFTATKEVVEAESIIQKRKLNEELVKLIAYYREQYPLQKFITEDQVKEICKKYSLIYHRASAYTGFVPESKLKLMEGFAVKEKDACYVAYSNFNRHKMYVSYEDYLAGVSNISQADIEFLIVAPQRDFTISSREEIREYKVVAKPIPDPVVLAPVRGGYLIVAAWGEEASDPIVVNDINN